LIKSSRNLAGFCAEFAAYSAPRRVLAHPRNISPTMSNRCRLPAQQYSFVFSKGQDDLADVLARLHASVGFGGFAQREGRVDHRLDPAARDQREHAVLDGASNGGLVRNARARRSSPYE
jgi:hypothetical protein